MKTFTNEDLARLKERCKGDDLIGILDYELPALIARLEAAELVIEFTEGIQSVSQRSAMEKWLKSCGRERG